MAPEDLLTFDYPGLASRTEALFEELKDRGELAEQFASNPAGVLSERVFRLPDPLSSGEIDRTNRFLFSLLSNSGFMRWAQEWQDRHRDQVRVVGEGEDAVLQLEFDRREAFQELSEAVFEHVDGDTLAELGIEAVAPGEEDLFPGEGPEEIRTAESRLKLPRPKPVNFNVAVNATVGVSLVGVVAAAVVVVLVIPIIVVGLLETEPIDREDLRRVAAGLNEQLISHAERLRDEGELRPGSPA